MTSCRFTYRY